MASLFTKDGWGRPLYYYRTANAYVLISFGKDGSPTPQVVPMDWVETAVGDFNSDIVIISGDWAQAPGDSGR